MYQEFYGLRESPFNVTADPDFFFSSQSHSNAISSLLYGIEQRKGILVISGEVGTGKTTLCRKLLRQSSKNVKFALILNPKFSELELLQMIIHDLGINNQPKKFEFIRSLFRRKNDSQPNKFDLIRTLNDFLIRESNKGNNVVVIIDEAQNLSVSQLEQIRLLSNLETEKEKLLQIILVGQPELHDKLRLPELRQLRQRIAVYYNIETLEKNDVRNYIFHRIARASKNADTPYTLTFTEQAFERIYHYTQGSPRAINVLCDRALLAGFVDEKYSINDQIIENCAKEILNCEHHL